jgi:hypothetical protein
MGMAIYYTARRARKLSEAEQASVQRVIRGYSAEEQIDAYQRTGVGWNGEDLCLYQPPFDSPDVILEGATRLPDSSVEPFWDGLPILRATIRGTAEASRCAPGGGR